MRLYTENVAQMMIKTARQFDRLRSSGVPKEERKRLMTMPPEEFEQEIKKFEQAAK